MLLRHSTPTRNPFACFGLLALLGLALACGDSGSSEDRCAEVCAHIGDECAPDGFSPRSDCEEACRAELRSRTFDNGEDTCLECCATVTLPENKCTDVFTDCQDSNVNNPTQNDKCVIGDNAGDDPTDMCQRRYGLSICLDDPTVCATECADLIIDIPIEECGP